MPKRITTSLHAIYLALAVLFSLAAAADAQCFSPRETKQKIKRGEVVPISRALRRANIRGRVVKARLCRGPVYNVTILGPDGALLRRSISAKKN